jgi:23S rRNA-/tRNA-specific pseudouridylate synthase
MFHRAADPPEMQEDDQEKRPSLDAFGNPVVSDDDMMSKSKLQEDDDAWKVEKTYWALTTDVPSSDRGTIDRHLYVPPESGIDISDEERAIDEPDQLPTQLKVSIQHPSRVSPYHHRFVKRAMTKYEVLDTAGKRGAWLRLQPQTGRKHQLRVHCADALHAPILGDQKYGVKSFRTLYDAGWGTVFDFSKWTGIKSTLGEDGGGMPMFLHLRQLVIRNYFPEDEDANNGRPSPYRQGRDLVLIAGLPEHWRLVMQALNLDASLKS